MVDGRVYKSINGGATWTDASTPVTDDVLALAIDPITPTTLYAATRCCIDPAGIYKSTDGGGSWQAVNSGLPAFAGVRALVIDPSSPTTLYAGLLNRGVYKSTDGGTSWSAASAGLLGATVNALALDRASPSTLYAALSFQGSLYKSTNGGTSWQAANTGLHDLQVFNLAITSTALYAGTGGRVHEERQRRRPLARRGPSGPPGGPAVHALAHAAVQPRGEARVESCRRDGVDRQSSDPRNRRQGIIRGPASSLRRSCSCTRQIAPSQRRGSWSQWDRLP
jgi:hypothetical protein